MKKALLLVFCMVASVATALADQAVFDFTKPTELTPAVTPSSQTSSGVSVSNQKFVNNTIEFTATKGGSNDARVWTKAGPAYDLRVYKNGGMLIINSTTANTIKSITFTGEKTSSMTPSEGTYANNTWKGDAETVTFTATNTLYIETVTVNYGDVEEPTEPQERNVFFTEPFKGEKGQFSIEEIQGNAGVIVWNGGSEGKDSYMEARSYSNDRCYASQVWLLSPTIDLTHGTDCKLVFEQDANFFNSPSNVKNALHVKVKKASGNMLSWKTLELDAWPTGNLYNGFITSTADLSEYDGEKIQLAFEYTSSNTEAGSWRVRNVEINALGEPGGVKPKYTSLADMKAAATTTEVASNFEFTDLLVTGVGLRGKNYTVYVSDGTDAAIFYGPNEPVCKKGDKITGKLAGNLCLYNGLLEMTAADYTAVKVASSDNAVTPALTTVADLLNDTEAVYQSQYMRLENVYFKSDKLTGSNITVLDDADNEIVLRDNFNVLTDFIFDTTKAYNINGYVAYYNGKAQLYPCAESDIEMITNLEDPETAWTTDEVVLLPGEPQEVENMLNTYTNAQALTYTSSDENVATIDAQGHVTVKGYGFTTISVETPETDKYLASKASYTLYVIEGTGSLETPFTAADLQYYNNKPQHKVWVKGEILGYISNTATGAYSPVDEKVVNTNLAIGSATCHISVQLPKGDLRDALNVKDHPEHVGKTIWLYGDAQTYCNIPGMKNCEDYSWDGKSSATGIVAVEDNRTGEVVIYSLDGRRLTQPVKGVNIINGKKVLVK